VGGTSVVGTGEIFGLRLVKPLEPRDQYFQSLLFGFDYKMFDQSVALVGQDSGSTPIHYAPFTFGYEGTLRSDSHITSASLAGHLSIRGLGNNAEEFETKRANARPNYFYFTADLKHQQLLPYDFQFVGRASGQITDGPLISNEQYAAGGMQSVRGYYQTQQLGDNGVNLSAELQTPMLFKGAFEGIDYFRVLTFFDWAYLWIIDPLPGNPAFYQLAGTGMGLRAQVYKHFIGELDWGYPFYAQGTVQPGNNRVDFRLVYEF
jgi:hemolysin activation/secretion protein